MELMQKQGYKQTEVGLIPEDWDIESIGDLASISTGSSDTQDRVQDGIYPFFVRSQTIERINKFSFDGESILTSGDGVGVGKIFHYVNCKFDYHQRVYNIHNYRKDVVGKYLFFQFSTNFFDRVMAMTAKSSVDSVRREMISNMKIPLPPILTEQKAIATALSDVDDLIANLDKIITKKKAIKQGAMQQLLIPPHKGGKRLAGFTGEWMEKKLGDVLNNYELGGNYENIETESDYPLIKMGNLGRGNIKLNKVQYIPNHIKPMDRDLLNYGDVLFNTRNTLDLVGKISIWKNELPKAYFNSNIMRLDFNENHVGSSFFMNYILNTPKVITDLKSFATGTTSVSAIYTRDLLKLELCLPSPEEQKAIAHLILDLDNEIQMLISKKVKYQDIKQGMMQELLTGKTRLV